MYSRHNQSFLSVKGFTLLEMAIVLVVIALVAGGIAVGSSLVRQAKIRAMLGEYDHYLKSIQEFVDKYQTLPGDMTTATGIWGADPDGCLSAYSDLPATGACNGNGNGTIGASSTAGVLTVTEEWFYAWNHLNLAGFVESRFTNARGNSGAQTSHAMPGKNVPASKLVPGGWTLFYYQFSTTNAHQWGTSSCINNLCHQYGHLFSFGANASGTYTSGVVLTPSETLDIDMKLDDGKPGRGKVRVPRTGGGAPVFPAQANCTENDTSADNARYKSTYTQAACAPLFVTGF